MGTAQNEARIRLSPKQAVVWHLLEKDPYVREVLFGGAAGPGKTFTGCLWQITRRLLYPETRGLVGRSRLTNLRVSTLKTFFEVWNKYARYNPAGITMRYNENQNVASFSNGSEILFKDLFLYPSDPDFTSLGSIEITDAFIDEASEITEKAFEIVGTRIRHKLETLPVQKPKILLCSNPANNWIKWRFVLNKENKPVELDKDQAFIPATLDDNPDEKFREIYGENLSRLNNYDQRRLRFGDWTATDRKGYEFYHAFNLYEHVHEIRYDVTMPVHLTFDQNVNPYITMLCWQVERVGQYLYLRQFDEFCLEHPRNSTASLCTAFKERYPECREVLFYGDASGHRRDTRGSETDYTIIRRELAGIIHAASDRTERSNPPVGARRDYINEIFENKHNFRISIAEKCSYTMQDMLEVKQDANGHKLKEKAVNPKTGGTFERIGHTSDALDYFIVGVDPQAFDNYRRR